MYWMANSPIQVAVVLKCRGMKFSTTPVSSHDMSCQSYDIPGSSTEFTLAEYLFASPGSCPDKYDIFAQKKKWLPEQVYKLTSSNINDKKLLD